MSDEGKKATPDLARWGLIMGLLSSVTSLFNTVLGFPKTAMESYRAVVPLSSPAAQTATPAATTPTPASPVKPSPKPPVSASPRPTPAAPAPTAAPTPARYPPAAQPPDSSGRVVGFALHWLGLMGSVYLALLVAIPFAWVLGFFVFLALKDKGEAAGVVITILTIAVCAVALIYGGFLHPSQSTWVRVAGAIAVISIIMTAFETNKGSGQPAGRR